MMSALTVRFLSSRFVIVATLLTIIINVGWCEKYLGGYSVEGYNEAAMTNPPDK